MFEYISDGVNSGSSQRLHNTMSTFLIFLRGVGIPLEPFRIEFLEMVNSKYSSLPNKYLSKTDPVIKNPSEY